MGDRERRPGQGAAQKQSASPTIARLVRTIDRLVFVADRNGAIGAGVLQELVDAACLGLPIAHLDARQRLTPLERVAVRFLRGGEARRLAWIEPSPEKAP
jgi:hypothetical protein